MFGWKELTITYSFEDQARLRDALSQAGIDYKVKTVDRTSPSPISPARRAYTGTYGETAGMYEYVFSVRKEDLERAKSLL